MLWMCQGEILPPEFSRRAEFSLDLMLALSVLLCTGGAGGARGVAVCDVLPAS